MNKVHSLGSKKITTAIFVLLIGAIGGAILFTSNAATPAAPSIYLTTPTTVLATNKQFTFDIRENSGINEVLSYDLHIDVPASLVSCTKIDTNGSPFGAIIVSNIANNQINLTASVKYSSDNSPVGVIKGDQFLGRITCDTLGVSGNADIKFASNTTLPSIDSNNNSINLVDTPAKRQGLNLTIDGQGPIVTIQGLSNSQSLNSGTILPVIINTTDTSELASLEIKIDGTSKQIINTTSKSYTYQWNNTGLLGSHTFQVIAKDALGNSGQSSIINVNIVDKTAPTVTLSPVTTPVAGTITLSATASDSGGGNVSKVEFYAGSTKVGEDTTSPYSLLWNTKNGSFPDGSYSLTAKAYDNASPANMGTSNAVNVTVKNKDDVPPSAPSNLKLTNASQNSLTISWSASTDNIGVTGYRVSRTGMQNVTVTNPSFTENNLIPNTSYTYNIVAFDAADNQSTTSTITVTTLTQKIGDFDNDNIVGYSDVVNFVSHWLTTSPLHDLNKNGLVDIYDLSLLLFYYGK